MPRRIDTRDRDFDPIERTPLAQEGEEALRRVRGMLNDIRREDWEKVIEYSREFDDVSPRPEALSPHELNHEWKRLDSSVRDSLKCARDRIRRYQTAIKPESSVISDPEGGFLGERVQPIESVGCYIPGGRVPLPSTVLMTAYIAHLAEVDSIVICSPPREDGAPHPVIQAACHLVPEAEVYGIGGVQAVGAMAFGSGSLPSVDLVAGPGNRFVTLAKKELYGEVGVDMLAGPSEIAIIADEQATAEYCAVDLLSQAEHDPRSRVYLISPVGSLIDRVDRHIEQLLEGHPNRESIETSLDESAYIHTRSVQEYVGIANDIAPEHLELHVENPQQLARDCEHAGAVFCGPYSPEPIGDYVAGPSHTLPTGGSARFFSPVSINTFLKRQSLISLDRDGFNSVRESASDLAGVESLSFHQHSVDSRETS
ncbi:MAG: histidinol dehydrogenase [bacterium]